MMNLWSDWRVTALIVVFGAFSCWSFADGQHARTVLYLAFVTGFNLRTMLEELTEWVDAKALELEDKPQKGL